MARGSDTGSPLAFSCDCGTITGHLQPVQGNHVVCFCVDCRAAEQYLGRTDPAPEPVDLFQTLPNTVSFDTGRDRLAAFRLGPKGPLRWYANCCRAPMFNTLGSAKLPFAAIHAARLTEPGRIGPVVIRSFAPQPGGKSKTEGAVRMVTSVLAGMLVARLNGDWRQTPFFDETGAPLAKPQVLAREERARFYPLSGG